MTYRITPQVYEKIKHYSKFPQTGVSLRQMVQFGQNPSQGTLFRASQFLADELPIRLAHRVKELEELPHSLSKMPSIIKVKNWYAQSFEDLINFPKIELPVKIKERLAAAATEQNKLPDNVPNLHVNPTATDSLRPLIPLGHRYENEKKKECDTGEEEGYYANLDGFDWPPEIYTYNEKFTKLIENIKRRHDPVVTTMGKGNVLDMYHPQGILEHKKHKNADIIDLDAQKFLDRFYMSRIGIRMLIGQHVALNRSSARDDYVGIICTSTNIKETVKEAAENAKYICEAYYGIIRTPEVQLFCPRDLNFTYVPSHLSHMLFELLKNSLRAVVELLGDDAEDYPHIKVIVAEGKEDITIKISDEGGGIPRSETPLVWTYMYTTAKRQNLDPSFNQKEFKAPMAGFGYGLPISRLYAKYFGGDLKLISMEG
ncbi:3474_t:CDS:10, partial [Paraglomus occultum]